MDLARLPHQGKFYITNVDSKRMKERRKDLIKKAIAILFVLLMIFSSMIVMFQ